MKFRGRPVAVSFYVWQFGAGLLIPAFALNGFDAFDWYGGKIALLYATLGWVILFQIVLKHRKAENDA